MGLLTPSAAASSRSAGSPGVQRHPAVEDQRADGLRQVAVRGAQARQVRQQSGQLPAADARFHCGSPGHRPGPAGFGHTTLRELVIEFRAMTLQTRPGGKERRDTGGRTWDTRAQHSALRSAGGRGACAACRRFDLSAPDRAPGPPAGPAPRRAGPVRAEHVRAGPGGAGGQPVERAARGPATPYVVEFRHPQRPGRRPRPAGLDPAAAEAEAGHVRQRPRARLRLGPGPLPHPGGSRPAGAAVPAGGGASCSTGSPWPSTWVRVSGRAPGTG